MMEKRRRARINASLEQLKKLVLDATRRDVSTTRDRFQATEISFNHFNEPRWEDRCSCKPNHKCAIYL